jgi:hypothetical protein
MLEFNVTQEQYNKFLEWSKNHPKSRAVDGAMYTWHFTPTSIGTVVIVSKNNGKDRLDLTDYENW